MQTEKPTSVGERIFRKEEKPRYDLIPYDGMRRLALRYTLGAKNYGDDNWKDAPDSFWKDVPNHIVEHIYLWLKDGCKEDDNLAAAAWGCFALMWKEEQNKNGATNDTKTQTTSGQ